MLIHRALVLFVLGLLATSLRADVLVVDASGGGDFTTIQAAVDSAAPRDIVLVRGGTYPGFVIDSTSIVVTADSPLVMTGSVRIQNIGAEDQVVVAGFAAESTFAGRALSVIDCAGEVRIQDCSFEGATVAEPLSGQPVAGVGDACVLFNASSVVLDECSFRGVDADLVTLFSQTLFPSGAGLLILNSTAHLYGAVALGGEGGSTTDAPNPASSPSLFALGAFDRSTVFLIGGSYTGAQGTSSASKFGPTCPPNTAGAGKPGAPGVLVSGGSSVVVQDASVAGGAGGFGGSGCPRAPDGPPFLVFSGSLSNLPGPARDFDLTSPVREGEVAVAKLKGASGEFAFLLAALSLDTSFEPGLEGCDLLGDPLVQVLFAGVLGSDGSLSLSLPFGAFPDPALEGARLHTQALFFDASTKPVFGPAATIVLLDQQF